jgi:hypothetical protein
MSVFDLMFGRRKLTLARKELNLTETQIREWVEKDLESYYWWSNERFEGSWTGRHIENVAVVAVLIDILGECEIGRTYKNLIICFLTWLGSMAFSSAEC